MKKIFASILLGLVLAGPLSAGEAIEVDGQRLELKAQARACYLGFIELYDVDYFRGAAGPASCVRLSYLRDIEAATLEEATRKVFEERHGGGFVSRYRAELERVGKAYRSVAPGDQYLYCVAADGTGSLLRDNAAVVQLASSDFARRFLQIWVQDEDPADTPQWGFGQC
ncbi:MAG: hypothetical protein KJN79_10160 [Gammaproteobacteria bacterium]|jgi:hypothetical protein|nr:hypothetical protein [Gammaproteobacteria bacterium]